MGWSNPIPFHKMNDKLIFKITKISKNVEEKDTSALFE
jgi:hypothetical protein